MSYELPALRTWRENCQQVRVLLYTMGVAPRALRPGYIGNVAERMRELVEQHDEAVPRPEHGVEDMGMCVECDARRALTWLVP